MISKEHRLLLKSYNYILLQTTAKPIGEWETLNSSSSLQTQVSQMLKKKKFKNSMPNY